MNFFKHFHMKVIFFKICFFISLSITCHAKTNRYIKLSESYADLNVWLGWNHTSKISIVVLFEKYVDFIDQSHQIILEKKIARSSKHGSHFKMKWYQFFWNIYIYVCVHISSTGLNSVFLLLDWLPYQGLRAQSTSLSSDVFIRVIHLNE